MICYLSAHPAFSPVEFLNKRGFGKVLVLQHATEGIPDEPPRTGEVKEVGLG